MRFNIFQEVLLEEVARYSAEKIEVEKVDKSNYVSTENLLPNFGGKKHASSLPKTKKVTNYSSGDTLISNIRPYFKKVWFANENGGASNDVLVIKAKENIDRPFLYYSLANDSFIDFVMSGAKGTKMPRGDKTHIMTYKLYLPPKKEQKAIANILSSLDEKIEVNNQINETLENMAQTLFKQWFVDFEFPNEDGEPYKSSGGKMVDSDLGSIPEGWIIGSFESLGEIVSGATPSKKRDEYFTDKGISWITPKDLSNNKNKYMKNGATDITVDGLKNSSAKLMPKGSVLFSSRAPIGYIAIADCEISTNQGFKSIIPYKNFSSEYIYQELKNKTELIISHASGSTFKEISGKGLKAIPIVIPSEKILKGFNELVKPISISIKGNEEETEILKKIRDTLLPQLMSGEIRVPIDETVESVVQ